MLQQTEYYSKLFQIRIFGPSFQAKQYALSVFVQERFAIVFGTTFLLINKRISTQYSVQFLQHWLSIVRWGGSQGHKGELSNPRIEVAPGST